jgi:uncharacterized protein
MTDAYIKEVDAWRAMQAGNYEKAARLYEPLAAQGSETALICLGSMYERGRLGVRDEEKAISLWEKAASAGSAPAKYRLGRLFKNKGDFSSARKWFVEGAKQNHKPSLYMGGRMLMCGQGGDVESHTGRTWMLLAADGGHVFAQRDLLRMQIRDSRSLWTRLRLYRELVRLIFSGAARYAREPYSEDFH